MITEQELAWARQQSTVLKQTREEADARWMAFKERLERKLLAARDSRPSATPAGQGWRVIPYPRSPHTELEALAHDAWALGFHAIPWPDGWRVRWGALTHALDNALAVCVTSAKLIVVSERRLRGRTPRELIRTVLHELTHVLHPREVHGLGFTTTLEHVLDYVLPPPDAVAADRPESPKGRRFDGRLVTWPGAAEWEFRG